MVFTRPRQEEGGSAPKRDSALPGSRQLLGRTAQSWLGKAPCLLPTPGPLSQTPEVSPTFPQTEKAAARTGCWLLTWHRVPAAASELRARTRPPFIHLRPSGERRGRWPMVGDRGLRKAGPLASRIVNGPGTHLWRMRSEESSVHGVMGVVVSALCFEATASGQNYKYQDAQKAKRLKE